MPAYSFQKKFCAFVYEGSKKHTIRQRRKKGNPKPGDRLFLYHGLRTKQCFKLGEAICEKVLDIEISEKQITLTEFKEDEASMLWLVGITADRLAWRDGFRLEGSSQMTVTQKGSFEFMKRFFREQYGLPFKGIIIYWKDFEKSEHKLLKKLYE